MSLIFHNANRPFHRVLAAHYRATLNKHRQSRDLTEREIKYHELIRRSLKTFMTHLAEFQISAKLDCIVSVKSKISVSSLKQAMNAKC